MYCKSKFQGEVLGGSAYTNVHRILYCRISLFLKGSYSPSSTSKKKYFMHCFPTLLNHQALYLNSIQRELYVIRQIWEMLITLDATCPFLINKPDIVMSFQGT